jgi:hypothetical protein
MNVLVSKSWVIRYLHERNLIGSVSNEVSIKERGEDKRSLDFVQGLGTGKATAIEGDSSLQD